MNDKPKKFFFDLNDFSKQEAVNKKEEDKSFKEEDLNAAREESFKLGVQEATEKIRAERAERDLQVTEHLTSQLNALLQREEQRENGKVVDTARLTLSIVKKLMPQFVKKYSEEEIVALVKQACQDRSDEPRLVVTVHDTVLESLRGKIDDIARNSGYQGQVIMIADDNISPHDCRIEWADGGLEKDFDKIFQAVEQAFHNALNRQNHIEKSAEINDAQSPQIE